MRKVLFSRILILTAVAVLLCCSVATLILAGNEQKNKENEMLTLLGLMRVTYDKTDVHDYNLAYEFSDETDNARIVFIDKDGRVFVDTGMEGEPSENHNNRPEVILARNSGQGTDTRKSQTLGKNQLYAAVRTADDDIIRISYDIKGIVDFIPQLIPVMILAMFLSLIVGVFLTRNIVEKITNPIYEAEDSLVSMMYGDCSKEIPPHKYDELNGFIYVFNKMRKSINEYIESLECEKKLVSFILENMNEGVVLFNNNMNIVMTNSSGLNFLGSNADDVSDKSIHHLVHSSRVLSAAENAVSTMQSDTFDMNSGSRIFSVRIKPVALDCTADKCVSTGGLMVLIDVTDKRQAEKMRQDFFANAGHELKTPLTAIIGFAELFENGLVAPDKRDDYMSKIVYEARRMSAIISDILEISSLENSQLPEDNVECDMLAIANFAAESLMPLANYKNVSVEVTGEGFVINAAQNHMHEIIDNLLSNAIKYNKKYGKATIDISQNESFGIITCSDTGIGIPYESQSRVFERFYRVDKGRSTKEGSTGLGLSIVKHIVNAYNGSISLSSRPSEGTTIIIKLPLEKVI